MGIITDEMVQRMERISAQKAIENIQSLLQSKGQANFIDCIVEACDREIKEIIKRGGVKCKS